MFWKASEGAHEKIQTHRTGVDFASGRTSSDAFYEVKLLLAPVLHVHTCVKYFNKLLCSMKLKTPYFEGREENSLCEYAESKANIKQ